jgi:hypothetical protein
MKATTKEELAGARRLVRRVNKNRPSGGLMSAYARECSELPRQLRGFEGHAITSAQLFSNAPEQGESAFFRMEALARLVAGNPLPGWTKPGRDGGLLTLEVLFAAAADARVILSEGEITFDRESLLKRAFQVAKREARGRRSPRPTTR